MAKVLPRTVRTLDVKIPGSIHTVTRVQCSCPERAKCPLVQALKLGAFRDSDLTPDLAPGRFALTDSVSWEQITALVGTELDRIKKLRDSQSTPRAEISSAAIPAELATEESIMSDKNARTIVRIANPIFAQLKRFAVAKGIDFGEAADLLVQGDINRRAALAKFAAKAKSKTPKPVKAKTPKAKSGKGKPVKSKTPKAPKAKAATTKPTSASA